MTYPSFKEFANVFSCIDDETSDLVDSKVGQGLGEEPGDVGCKEADALGQDQLEFRGLACGLCSKEK